MERCCSSFHLVRNPHLITRVKEEITRIIPADGSDISRSHIQQLPFLRCVLNESQCLPIIWNRLFEC